VDVLDALSIEDVLDLHRVAIEERFVDKYNAIQERTKQGLTIRDHERLVLLMDELEEFERQLHADYRSAIEKELPRHLKNLRKAAAAKLLNAVGSLLIPAWGAADDVTEAIVAGLVQPNAIKVSNWAKQSAAVGG